MELKDFISTVLIDICDGIAMAKSQVKDCAISPGRVMGKDVYEVQQISFDISVTVDETTKSTLASKGGLSIKVISASIGGDTENMSNKINVNRLTFSVPYIPHAISPNSDNNVYNMIKSDDN